MIKIVTKGKTALEVAQEYAAAKQAIRPNGGLAMLMYEAIGQLHRFVAANIQVDKENARNSLFTTVSNRGNGVQAMLGATARHAPYVGYKDGDASTQFMKYAKEKEVPHILNWLEQEVVVTVEEKFD